MKAQGNRDEIIAVRGMCITELGIQKDRKNETSVLNSSMHVFKVREHINTVHEELFLHNRTCKFIFNF